MDAEVYVAAVEGSWKKLNSEDWQDQASPEKNTILHLHVERPIKKGKVNIEFIRNVLKEIQSDDYLFMENESGDIPLHVAARSGQVEAVKEFLQLAKPEDEEAACAEKVKSMLRKTNRKKDTALHEAARAGYDHIVKLLVEADPSFSYEANDAKETPLYLAAESGSPACVAAILDSCDPSALAFAYAHKGPCGQTALHALVQWGCPEGIVHKLLNKDESLIRAEDDEGSTPLHYAAAKNNQLMKLLLSCENKTAESAAYMRDKEGQTPLHIATREMNWLSMEELITCHPDCVEIVDKIGKNVVHYAATWACTKKLNKFLKLGHDLSRLMNRKDYEGNTPLHLLAANISYMTCVCLCNVENFMKCYQQYMKILNNENCTPGDILASKHSHQWGPYPELLWRPPRSGRIVKINRGAEKEAISSSESAKWVPSLMDGAQSRLVVAALVATVSFTAGFTVPGGLNQNPGSDIGTAIMAKKASFKAFLVFDTLAMIFSSSAVFLYLVIAGGAEWFPYLFAPIAIKTADLSNILSIGAMMSAFLTGVYTVVPNSLGLHFGIFSISAYFLWFYVQRVCFVIFMVACYFHLT